jgi:hypothetical protein
LERMREMNLDIEKRSFRVSMGGDVVVAILS